MTVSELVAEFEAVGVRLWNESGQLRFRAPRGVLTEQRRLLLRDHKQALLEYLRPDAEVAALTPEPAMRFEPFPLTELQTAYLLGRQSVFAYGGVGSHIYAEIAFTKLAPDRVQAAWNELILRHDMLRAVTVEDGTQDLPTRPLAPV
jgi:pyochelin synthetase